MKLNKQGGALMPVELNGIDCPWVCRAHLQGGYPPITSQLELLLCFPTALVLGHNPSKGGDLVTMISSL